MRKLLLLCVMLLLLVSCSNRLKELKDEGAKNLSRQIDIMNVIIEKQEINKGDDGFAVGARARIKELEAEDAKLKERYKIINDSIELLK